MNFTRLTIIAAALATIGPFSMDTFLPSLPDLPYQRDGRDGPAPLSLFQQRFWFLDRAGQPYRASLALQLNGDLDVAAFEHALAEVVRRHEVLRSCFPAEDGRPMQHVLPLAGALAHAEVEVAHVTEDNQRPRFHCATVHQAAHFDPEFGYPLRYERRVLTTDYSTEWHVRLEPLAAAKKS